MAVSLCSDWGTMERAMLMDKNVEINGGFFQQYTTPTIPFGFFGSLSPLDSSDLPLFEQLFDGSPHLDDYLLPGSSLDPHHLSSLLSSDPSATMFSPDLCPASSELDAYIPSSLLVSTNPFGASCLEPQFLQSDFAFGSPLENPEAMALQTPPPAAAAGFLGAGGYPGRALESGAAGGCPSAQSVAARQRRKRISEKTHELGQLVPGGCRMNTAEMLQAAFKYVKFLQAQVGILDLMRSSQAASREEELQGSQQHLQALLASPAVQEKLASEERCVVPECMVRALMEDREIKSHPSICRNIRGLTPSMG